MTIYQLLEKKQRKRNSFYKSHEHRFFLSNKYLLNKIPKFAYLLSNLDEFNVMRANIIIRGILNKKLIEEEIDNLNKYFIGGEKLDHVKLLTTIKERLVDEPYFACEKNKIYIPFFSRTLNQIYIREPEKLLYEPYLSLRDDYNDSIVDPFDTYGANLFDSLFSRLLKVGTNGKEVAYFHYDTNTIYIVNEQGRLDSKLVLFDTYLRRPNYNHMLERIAPVVSAYFDDDRTKMVNALFESGFISSKFYQMVNKGKN